MVRIVVHLVSNFVSIPVRPNRTQGNPSRHVQGRNWLIDRCGALMDCRRLILKIRVSLVRFRPSPPSYPRKTSHLRALRLSRAARSGAVRGGLVALGCYGSSSTYTCELFRRMREHEAGSRRSREPSGCNPWLLQFAINASILARPPLQRHTELGIWDVLIAVTVLLPFCAAFVPSPRRSVQQRNENEGSALGPRHLFCDRPLLHGGLLLHDDQRLRRRSLRSRRVQRLGHRGHHHVPGCAVLLLCCVQEEVADLSLTRN